MGRELAQAFRAARDVFDEVDAALSQHLSKIMWGDDEAGLRLTENAQPALMAVSLAVIRVLETQCGFRWGTHAQVVAGHSLGEYSALTAAGAFSLADAARLLRRRGIAMQKAVPVGVGAMAIPLGAEIDVAQAIASEASTANELCEIANDNAPGQVVLSGHKAAIDRVSDIAKAKGVKRVLPVAVSAPFHCALMAPAAREMAEALNEAQLLPPRVPVIANVSLEWLSDPAAIRTALVAQVTGRVRWRETVLSLRPKGYSTLVEVGAGKVLTGQAKRTDAELMLVNLETPKDIEAFQAVLTQTRG